MSAPSTLLPIARLLYPVSEEAQEWPDLLLLDREQLTAAGLLSEHLVAAGWEVTLHHDGEILELVARKRHHTLHAAVAELLALEAGGNVYLDAPDEGSTISPANLAEPGVHYPVDGPPPES